MREQDSVAVYFAQAALHGLHDQPERLKAVLTDAGIELAILSEPQARLPADAAARLWLALSRELDDEFFAFDSHGMPPGSFALICRGLIQEPTLGKALRQYLSNFRLFLRDISGRLEIRGRRAVIVLDNRLSDPAVRGVAEEIFLSMAIGVLCWLAGRRIPLDRTQFAHPRPAQGADPLLWGPLLEFDAKHTEVEFDAVHLSLPVVQDLVALKQFLRTSPNWVVVRFRNRNGLAAQVYRRLRHNHEAELPTQTALACEHGMSAASFRRQLEREGFTFQAIKHEVRRAIAL
ncbi:AraC family transcriptional regulator, partial [Pseudomonas sp. CrR25]|nr:AraC family transcriptional regulator [Pseudomonas sp. CrR25]